jgi:hypothetical protein
MKKWLVGFLIWMVSALLQVNVFHIEHDAYVMLYGAVTMALMILAMTVVDKDGK